MFQNVQYVDLDNDDVRSWKKNQHGHPHHHHQGRQPRKEEETISQTNFCEVDPNNFYLSPLIVTTAYHSVVAQCAGLWDKYNCLLPL